MSKVISFTTDTGEVISVEATPDDLPVNGGDMEMVGSSNQIVIKLRENYEQAFQIIRSVGNQVIKNAQEIEKSLEEVQIKMNLKFNIEAGFVIAKTNAQADLEIQMKWNKTD